jgi:hypothetical protein
MRSRYYSKDDKKIVCNLEALPLASGMYSMTLMLRVWQQEAWDYKERAVIFKIESDLEDFTGFDYQQQSSGPLYIKQEWC